MSPSNKNANRTKSGAARTIRSVEDVIRMSSGHSKSHFLYRGEDSISYQLIPKVGRYEDAQRQDWFESETSALSDFYRRSTPYLPTNKLSEIEILAIGQHHGLATRLLDWSQNPLVAVYFACLKPTVSGNRRIYALNTEDMYYIDGDESPFKQARVMLYEPNHLSPRIVAQRGIFTVHPQPAVPFQSPNLEKWTIADSAVIATKIQIETLGFNDETMFPGLSGTASQVNAEYY